ncbi:MAG: hypothetical protein AABZ33_10320 [Chloroflexota bacterium]
MLRTASVDFYFNSWRLVPANATWGLLLVAVILVSVTWRPAAVLLIAIAIPTAGLHRMAARIYRGDRTSLWDFTAGMRRWAAPALGIGAGASLLVVALTANIVTGLEAGGVVGWTLSLLALYGEIAVAMFLVAAWPIVVDPRREHVPLRLRLRLAAIVILARPGRMGALTCVISAVLLGSTVLLAALLTVSVAFVSLVATHYVLPMADQLDGLPTVRRQG